MIRSSKVEVIVAIMDTTMPLSNITILLDAFGINLSTVAASKEHELATIPSADVDAVSVAPLTNTDSDLIKFEDNEKGSAQTSPVGNTSDVILIDRLTSQKPGKKQGTPSTPLRDEHRSVHNDLRLTHDLRHLLRESKEPSEFSEFSEELEKRLKQRDLETMRFWDELMGTNTQETPSPVRDTARRGYRSSTMSLNNKLMQNTPRYGDRSMKGGPQAEIRQYKRSETFTPARPKQQIDDPLGGYGRELEDYDNVDSKRRAYKSSKQARHAKASFIPPTNPPRQKSEAETKKRGALFEAW